MLDLISIIKGVNAQITDVAHHRYQERENYREFPSRLYNSTLGKVAQNQDREIADGTRVASGIPSPLSRHVLHESQLPLHAAQIAHGPIVVRAIAQASSKGLFKTTILKAQAKSLVDQSFLAQSHDIKLKLSKEAASWVGSKEMSSGMVDILLRIFNDHIDNLQSIPFKTLYTNFVSPILDRMNAEYDHATLKSQHYASQYEECKQVYKQQSRRFEDYKKLDTQLQDAQTMHALDKAVKNADKDLSFSISKVQDYSAQVGSFNKFKKGLTSEDIATFANAMEFADIKSLLSHEIISSLDPAILIGAKYQIICSKSKSSNVTSLKNLIKLLPKGGIGKMADQVSDVVLKEFLDNLHENLSIKQSNKEELIKPLIKLMTREELEALSPVWAEQSSLKRSSSSDMDLDDDLLPDSKAARADDLETSDDSGVSVTPTEQMMQPESLFTPIRNDENIEVDIVGDCSGF